MDGAGTALAMGIRAPTRTAIRRIAADHRVGPVRRRHAESDLHQQQRARASGPACSRIVSIVRGRACQQVRPFRTARVLIHVDPSSSGTAFGPRCRSSAERPHASARVAARPRRRRRGGDAQVDRGCRAAARVPSGGAAAGAGRWTPRTGRARRTRALSAPVKDAEIKVEVSSADGRLKGGAADRRMTRARIEADENETRDVAAHAALGHLVAHDLLRPPSRTDDAGGLGARQIDLAGRRFLGQHHRNDLAA